MAARRFSKRYRPIPTQRLPIRMIDATSSQGPFLEYPPGRPLLVHDRGRIELLLGGSKLHEQKDRDPHQQIPVIILENLGDADRQAILRLDHAPAPKPSEIAKGIRACRNAGMPHAQIAAILPVVRSIRDVTCYAGLMDEPELLGLLDRGALTLKHCKHLLPRPREDRLKWAQKAAQHNWSFARMLSAMEAEQAGQDTRETPDMSYLSREIGERLGTEVTITWNPEAGSGAVDITWFDAESLQGIFQSLAEGESQHPGLPSRRRLLRLEYDNAKEFDALFGHLTRGT